MKKKIGIFDLDGTLIDAYASVAETFNYALGVLGYPPVTLKKVKRAVGGGDRNLASKFVRDEHIGELMKIYRENYMRFVSGNIRLLSGCEELLSFLKIRNLRLGVATNRARFSVPRLMEELKIDKYFDIICTADDVSNPKPDPEMILNIINVFNSSREEVFYAGDMDIDFFAGLNAGVDTYILSTGSTPRDKLQSIDSINLFDGLHSLKNYLSGRMQI